jgi:hypothetical protein
MKTNHKATEILTVIDGNKVKGYIKFLSSSDISVEITYPFTGISSGIHIPYFAMVNETYHFLKDGMITESGSSNANWLLEELYKYCSYFRKNKKSLKSFYENSEKEFSKISNGNADAGVSKSESTDLCLKQKFEAELALWDFIKKDANLEIGVETLHSLINAFFPENEAHHEIEYNI